MKKCNLSEDLAQDQSEWRNVMLIADPNNIVETKTLVMVMTDRKLMVLFKEPKRINKSHIMLSVLLMFHSIGAGPT